jgi:hypothetical protein
MTALLVVLLGAAGAPSPSRAASSFATDPLWDDGKAEVNLYDARQTVYDQVREFKARMIVVKEDFKQALRVKSDDGPVTGDTFEVLKLNHLRLIPTGSYDTHQMISAYLERATLRPVKLAMSNFESCGMTFVEVLPQGEHLSHISHSYWDGEGDRSLSIPFAADDLLYDALPLRLRGIDFAQSGPRNVNVLPTQMAGRVKNLKLVPMTLQVAGREKVKVPAGEFDVFRVELLRPEGKDRYYFEAASPHRLVKMEAADGGLYQLRKSLRLDYWNHHASGDEQLLQ